MARRHSQDPASESWRPLRQNERALLNALTELEFDGAALLREQLNHMSARKSCECGCGTISLRVDRSVVGPVNFSTALAPSEAAVHDETGQEIGGLILFVRDGYASGLEIFTWEDPAPLPPVERIRTYIVNR